MRIDPSSAVSATPNDDAVRLRSRIDAERREAVGHDLDPVALLDP